MSVFWRSWVTLCLAVATVLFVLGALATLQYEATLSELIRGRLVVLAQTARGSLQATLSLGLPLSAVRNAEAILERARQTDSRIVAAHAFEPSGRILHSTDAGHPTSVRAEVLFASTRAGAPFWHAETDEHLFAGASLSGPSGGAAGSLVLVYPRSELTTPVRAMTTRLAAYGVGVLALVALLAGLVLRTGLGRLVRALDGLDQMLAAVERREWRARAGSTDALPPRVSGFGVNTAELGRLIEQADARYLEAGARLGKLEAPDGEPASGGDARKTGGSEETGGT